MKSTLQTIFCLLLICTFSNTEANAQYTLDTKDFKAMNFRNIGPAGMSGRITAIDVDLSDKERIFAGSASGGLWLSENGGVCQSKKLILPVSKDLVANVFKRHVFERLQLCVSKTLSASCRDMSSVSYGIFRLSYEVICCLDR